MPLAGCRRFTPRGSWGLAMFVVLGLAAPFVARAAGEAQAEYGVTLAMSGEGARAESVFVSLLSNSRGDARALNNLGNLRLLRGEFGVALAFYDRALRGDSLDAGIQMNRATALLLMGDEPRAGMAASEAVRLAGGVDAAGALVGLKRDGATAAKASQSAVVNKDEIRSLLESAAAAVPSDTTRAQAAPAGDPAKKKTTPTWRSAGARASDASDAATVLYWKH